MATAVKWMWSESAEISPLTDTWAITVKIKGVIFYLKIIGLYSFLLVFLFCKAWQLVIITVIVLIRTYMACVGSCSIILAAVFSFGFIGSEIHILWTPSVLLTNSGRVPLSGFQFLWRNQIVFAEACIRSCWYLILLIWNHFFFLPCLNWTAAAFRLITKHMVCLCSCPLICT